MPVTLHIQRQQTSLPPRPTPLACGDGYTVAAAMWHMRFTSHIPQQRLGQKKTMQYDIIQNTNSSENSNEYYYINSNTNRHYNFNHQSRIPFSKIRACCRRSPLLHTLILLFSWLHVAGQNAHAHPPTTPTTTTTKTTTQSSSSSTNRHGKAQIAIRNTNTTATATTKGTTTTTTPATTTTRKTKQPTTNYHRRALATCY